MKSAPGSPRQLEAVDCAEQVRVDDVVRGAAVSGEDGRFRRTLDDEIDLSAAEAQIFRIADVAVHELHPTLAQAREIHLGAAPFQVIQGDDAQLRVAPLEPEGEV